MHVAWRFRARFSIFSIFGHPATRFPNFTRLSSYSIPLAINASKSKSTRHSIKLPIVTNISRLLFSSSCHKMEPNGDSRYKRKNSPVKHFERPPKLFKKEMPGPTHNGEASHEEFSEMETDSDDGRLLTLAPATADSAEWQATIEKVVRNVVSIHFCQTCSFDTDAAVSTEATGFVVDAERGYILTNRHVVGAGPFWGHCIFDNHEEVSNGPLNFSLIKKLICAAV